MPRNAIKRVDNTIDHILANTTAQLPPLVLNDVADMVTTKYPRADLQELNALKAMSVSLSVKRHIGAAVAKGDETERKDRRAIELLWKCMSSVPVDHNRAMSIAPGQAGAELARVLKRAAVFASARGAAHVFNNEFATSPLTFIRANKIKLWGDSSGAVLYTNLNAHIARNVLTHYFWYRPQEDAFNISPTNHSVEGASHQFQAINVPAIHWSEVPRRGATAAPAAPIPHGFDSVMATHLAGAPWMFTTQLTGCTFCYHANGNKAYAAHILVRKSGGPVGMSGGMLANQLMGNDPSVPGARFINVNGKPAPEIYGMTAGNAQVIAGNSFYPDVNASPTKWVYIFGQLLNDSWRIYTQEIGHNETVVHTRQLY